MGAEMFRVAWRQQAGMAFYEKTTLVAGGAEGVPQTLKEREPERQA